jgi:hypothetical protein
VSSRAIHHDLVLERVTLYTVERIDRQAIEAARAADDRYLIDRLELKGPRICEHEDAFEFRRVFRGFGKKSRQTMRCPATWWQHLKLALRTRWPRIFGRIAVRFDEIALETGALIAGLPDTLKEQRCMGARYIIPYTVEPASRSFVDAKRFGADA